MSATGARTQDTERAGYRWRPTRITSKDARYASFIAFIAWVFSVYDFILFGTLLPEMRGDFGWSEGYAATVSTLVSVGTLLRGPARRAADRPRRAADGDDHHHGGRRHQLRADRAHAGRVLHAVDHRRAQRFGPRLLRAGRQLDLPQRALRGRGGPRPPRQPGLPLQPRAGRLAGRRAVRRADVQHPAAAGRLAGRVPGRDVPGDRDRDPGPPPEGVPSTRCSCAAAS